MFQIQIKLKQKRTNGFKGNSKHVSNSRHYIYTRDIISKQRKVNNIFQWNLNETFQENQERNYIGVYTS